MYTYLAGFFAFWVFFADVGCGWIVTLKLLPADDTHPQPRWDGALAQEDFIQTLPKKSRKWKKNPQKWKKTASLRSVRI